MTMQQHLVHIEYRTTTEGSLMRRVVSRNWCPNTACCNMVMATKIASLDPFQQHYTDYQYINGLIEDALKGQ